MGLTISSLFSRLFGKKQMRILMGEAPGRARHTRGRSPGPPAPPPPRPGSSQRPASHPSHPPSPRRLPPAAPGLLERRRNRPGWGEGARPGQASDARREEGFRWALRTSLRIPLSEPEGFIFPRPFRMWVLSQCDRLPVFLNIISGLGVCGSPSPFFSFKMCDPAFLAAEGSKHVTEM